MNRESVITNIQLLIETAKISFEILMALIMTGNIILLSLATKSIILVTAVLAISIFFIARLIKKVHLWINK